MIDTIAERPVPCRQLPPEGIPGHINTACPRSGVWTTYVDLLPANPSNTACPCFESASRPRLERGVSPPFRADPTRGVPPARIAGSARPNHVRAHLVTLRVPRRAVRPTAGRTDRAGQGTTARTRAHRESRGDRRTSRCTAPLVTTDTTIAAGRTQQEKSQVGKRHCNSSPRQPDHTDREHQPRSADLQLPLPFA